MLTAVAFSLLLSGPKTVSLVPTDDLWVYEHASDAAHDPLLRVWGANGTAVAPDADSMQSYCYSYLKFDLSKVPAGKLTGATLTVTHISNPGFDVEYAKKHPLEARPLDTKFDEKTWDYGKSATLLPSADNKLVFGAGAPASIPSGKEFTITLDLMKGPNSFSSYFDKARDAKCMALALTSSTDVTEMGQACIYKFYSNNCDTAAKRPTLTLTFGS